MVSELELLAHKVLRMTWSACTLNQWDRRLHQAHMAPCIEVGASKAMLTPLAPAGVLVAPDRHYERTPTVQDVGYVGVGLAMQTPPQNPSDQRREKVGPGRKLSAQSKQAT